VTQHDQIDPFEALRLTDGPVTPRPAFADGLRDRLAAALAEGDPEMTTTPAPAPISVTVTPYLTVRGGVAALDFYRDAFGAVEDHRMVGDDGRVGHAAFGIGSARFFLADEHPEIGVLGPATYGGTTCAFTLDVPDVDALYARAIAAGATSGREPSDEFYGRGAWVTDPFGHRWNLTAQRGVSTEMYDAGAVAGGYRLERAGADRADEGVADHQIKHYESGDLYYFTLPVADLARAQAFFGEVLGWQFADATAGHVSNIAAPPGGVRPTDAPAGAELWFVVADIHTAVDAVRRMGGTASDPVLYESGWAAECTDDQGTRFNLSVPSAQYSR
jgi:uncharacterized glyoxalase superfamily protein PhnB